MVGSTDGKHSLLLLMPPVMLLHTFPYVEIPNQPWNSLLASVKPVTSSVSKSQPAQPDNLEVWVYVSNSEVWLYGLFPVGHMGKSVQVPCVYNYPPWGISRLTINKLDTLWGVHLLLQEKLEELEKFLVGSIFFYCAGENVAPSQ